MSGSRFLLVILLVGAIVGPRLMLLSWANAGSPGRTREMQQLAESLGFQFDAGPSKDNIRKCEKYIPLLHQGDLYRRAHNIMSGEYQGTQFTHFDFYYTTTHSNLIGSGYRIKKHLASVSLIELPRISPGLMISPEHARGKKQRRQWSKDIDFESHEFSEHFDVRSEDKKFAYDFYNPRMMEFLLTSEKLTLQIGGNHMLLLPQGWVERDTGLADLNRVRSCLDTLAELYSQIYSHIPNYLLEEDRRSAIKPLSTSGPLEEKEDDSAYTTGQSGFDDAANISPAERVRRLAGKSN